MKYTRLYKTALFVFLITFGYHTFAQLSDGFDIKQARITAKAKGIKENFLDEYVNHQHTLFLKNKKHAIDHKHSGNKAALDLGTIYKSYNTSGQYYKAASPQNAYCPNAGFEQYGFANWTGSTGEVIDGAFGAAFPDYTPTINSIVNPDGDNVSLVNENNYHTIMTTPATNNVYPNCSGYDSIAVRVIGTQTISEIPVVNPNGGPASVRMNGAATYLTEMGSKLTYNMALNPNNKSFSISYALVLQSGGHDPNEQPYFSVKVRDQNGNLVAGCSQYTVTIDDQVTTPGSASYDPSWKESILGFNDIFYRPWSTYAFDFSNYPTITSVTVEFYVGGCSLGGHFGYAYVDAECSTGGALASFCNGATSAVVAVPNGFTSYQWVGPNGPVPVINGGTSASATVSPVTAGQVFTCTATSANGCTSTFPTTITITSVSVTGVGSTPSCPNGNSGTANVFATGSSAGYNYQWLNSSGANVGSSQNVSGLSPGTYSVTVSSTGCGIDTETLVVGNAPPNFYSQTASFCGSTAWVSNASGGLNHKWYSSTGVAIAGANSATLTVNSPVNGANYFLAFTTASGCRDSIKYTLTQISGGSINVSNIKSICVGNSNSTAVINLATTAVPAIYSYSVTGPSGYNATLTNTSSTTFSVSNLALASTYSVNVFDGECSYNTTFSVTPYVFSYTLTPPTTTICSPGSTTLAVNFGNTTPTSCGLSTSGGCSSPSNIQVGNATTTGSGSYYTPYGGGYESARNQYLFRASELLAAGIVPGKLDKLAFNVTNLNSSSTAFSAFTIKLKCVTYSVIPTASMDNTGLNQVYGPQNINATVGWNTYNFTQAYEWDGVSNLLVDVCFFNTSWDGNISVQYTAMSYNSSKYVNADGSNQCPVTTVDNYGFNRPNVRFGNCAANAGPSAYSYTWTPSITLSSTNSFSTIANPSTSTIYAVQVEPIGQANCAVSKSSTVTVTTPATPTITPVTALCSNANSFTLSALPVGGTWSLTPSTSGSGVFTPSLASVGNNTVTYIYGGVGCLQSTTAVVPIEQFVPSNITGTINPLCVTNPSISLQTSLTTSTLGVGVWSGNGVSGTSFDPSTAGAAVHTLTYTTNSSPTASLCPSSSTIEVAVNTVAQPTITADGPFCNTFAPQQLVANPTGGTWSSGVSGANVSSTGLFIPNNSLIGLNKLYYTLTNAPCSKKDSIEVDVVRFIPATLTGALGPYCIYNPTVNLQSIALNNGGVWSGAGVTLDSFSPSAAGAGSHDITYKTDPVPSNLCPDTQTITIVVQAKPEANALVDIIAGCSPTIVNYSTTTYSTGSASWDFGDGTAVQNGLFAPHTYDIPGTYSATMTYTDNIGCIDTTICLQTVTIYSVPVAAFEPSLYETTVVDSEIQFTNQTSNLTNNVYTWNFGNIDTSSDLNPTYSFTTSGDYSVTLLAVSPENCRDSIVKKIIINPDVVLYVPNAFTPGNNDGLNDVFQIFLPATGVDYSTFNLSIYDRWGELVYKTNDVNASWTGAKNNSGAILKQDIYVWKIFFRDAKRNFYQKFGNVSLLNK